MFPKKGNYFPRDARAARYSAAIAAALHAELGSTHRAVKMVMRWTGANERTVKNWFAGTRGPRGEHLISLIAHSDLTLEMVLRNANRGEMIAAKRLVSARNILANVLTEIDAVINTVSDNV